MVAPPMDGVALIGGAASGIGRETAWFFAERGASAVVFLDLNLPGAEEAAEESKKYATHKDYKCMAVKVDVSEREMMREAVQKVADTYGRIDYFVNSSGIGPRSDADITKVNLDEFDLLHKINTKGLLIATGAVIEQMLKQDERYVEGRSGKRSVGKGCIVNMSSVAGKSANPDHVQYTSSKWAAIGVTKTAAREVAPKGIRVNCVCPCWTLTPMMEKYLTRTTTFAKRIDTFVPLKRLAYVEEIAAAAHFLCSPDASYIIGTDMVVDAGTTI